jgi:hypothetical protein
MGNEAKIDELGFVTPEKTLDSASFHVFTRIPQILKTGQIHAKHKKALDVSSNCWICEGWSQIQFKIPRSKMEELLKNDDYRDKFKEKYGVSCKVRVTLHMSFDNFKPHKMEFGGASYKDCYIICRMVAPGPLQYFYVVQYSNDLPGEKNEPKPLIDEINGVKDTFSKKPIQTEKFSVEVPKLNYIEGDVELLMKIIDTDDISRMIAKPRPEATITPRPKTPWKFEKSFFT